MIEGQLLGPQDNETVDDLLGGAMRLIQPRNGYRMAIDTVLLAAAVPAASDAHVVELGVGTGGAALALAYRTGAAVTGIEIQPDLAAYARRNVAFNGLDRRVGIVEGCVTSHPRDCLPGTCVGRVDHVMANPPFSEAGEGPVSPKAGKAGAHHHNDGTLAAWMTFAHGALRHKGTLTLIHRADRLVAATALLHPRFGDITVYPLWPRPGVAAKRVIVQARKGTRGGSRMLPGMALHGTAARYTAEAEAVLRHGHALAWQAGAQTPPRTDGRRS